MNQDESSSVSEETTEQKKTLSRRDLGIGLRTLGAALVGAGMAAPTAASLNRARGSKGEGRAFKAPLSGPSTGKPAFMLSIFLRGGADGLSILAPCDDPFYQSSRTVTRIWNPNDPLLPGRSMAGLPLSAGIPGQPDFWVPQALEPLKDLFDMPTSRLAFIHACGSADPTRSHFEQQNQMESGTTGNASAPLASGWCGRHLATKMDHITGSGLLRAISLDSLLSQTLREGPGATPVPDPAYFRFPIVLEATPQQVLNRSKAIEDLYSAFGAPLDTSMDSILEAMTLLGKVDFTSYSAGGGADYPPTLLGERLIKIAQLARELPVLEVAHVDVHSWDTHKDQGVHMPGQSMYDLMDDLAKSVKAFHLDMMASNRKFIVLIVTEFGRKVLENSSSGTDHGRGGVAMVSGSDVLGGQVYTTWPGLNPTTQQDQGDLAVTTDIRDVFGEITASALKNPNTDIVVPPEPGLYQYAPVGFLP